MVEFTTVIIYCQIYQPYKISTIAQIQRQRQSESSLHLHFMTFQTLITILTIENLNCETQPPASIGWVALSSVFVRCLSRIRYTSSHLHYMMFQTIQTIYFLWGYDPGNMSVSFIAELSPVYCCLNSWQSLLSSISLNQQSTVNSHQLYQLYHPNNNINIYTMTLWPEKWLGIIRFDHSTLSNFNVP